jgi:hypothetical protein
MGFKFLGLVFVLISSLAFADEVLEEGATANPSWCTLKKIKIAPDKSDFKIVFTGDKSDVLSVETITFDKADSWQSYYWEQKQTGEETKLDFDGSKLKFTYTEKGKKPEEKTKDIDSDEKDQLVVPPLLSVYARKHWADLEKNGKLDVVIAAPDRRDIFRFSFKKEDQKDPDKTELVLKAKSPFVALAVSPVHFVFDNSKDHKILSIRGFNPPVKYKSKDGELDAKKIDMDFKTFGM